MPDAEPAAVPGAGPGAAEGPGSVAHEGRGEAPPTVVIATRDRREQVLHTLGRLRELPERPPVILVDNASSDGTPEAVRAAFGEVDVVRLPRNRGAVARNVGVARARTPLVAFCDDDSWWQPGALGRAAAHFAAFPRLGLLAARVLVGPGLRPDPVSAAMAVAPLPRPPDLPGPSVLGFLAFAAVVRRDAFLGAGGFSPVLFFLGEEAPLAFDLACAGWGLAYAEDVVAEHHPARATRGPSTDRRRLHQRNDLLTAWLRRPLPVAARQTGRLLRAGLRDPAARGALADALRRTPDVLAGRRPVPGWLEAQVRTLEAAG